ncbi:MAG: CBS domain-containing protein [Lachnospiraceae bacterium]
MNIAFFLLPKAQVAYLQENYTIRQALEKMKSHGYTAIPVLNDEGKYIGTVSEGDFLWYLIDENGGIQKNDMKSVENIYLQSMLKEDKNPPVHITTSVEELLVQATRQNFVPVVDDHDVFIGIITRKDIIKYFADREV